MKDDTKAKLITLGDALSGIAKAPQRNSVRYMRTVIRESLQDDFMHGLGKAFEELVIDGRVEKDYINTAKGKATFSELLEAVDSEGLNQPRLDAIRAIFFHAAE